MMSAKTPQHIDWTLSDLLADALAIRDVAAVPVDGLALDSRQIRPGYVFLACAGTRQHGMEYLEAAVKNGAVAVLAEVSADWPEFKLKSVGKKLNIPLVIVDQLSWSVSRLAKIFFRNLDNAPRICAITGTNGKTSVAHYLAQMLNQQYRCGVMGTIGNGMLNDLSHATHTTPDAVTVQQYLSSFTEQGMQCLAMEVSSHALDQHRVAEVCFDTAVFTNLSRDHLDYHKTLEQYAAVKKSLFQKNSGIKHAVMNVDDVVGRQIAEELAIGIHGVTCSTQNQRIAGLDYVNATQLQIAAGKTTVKLETSWGNGKFVTRIPGRFNIDNLLSVIAVALAWKMPFQQVLTSATELTTIDGRMQTFGGGGLPLVVVDFAHTPDALEKALVSLKPYVTGQLKVVFGCGGDRDKGKRPQMAHVAEKNADELIITDDNPRSENSQDIINDIKSGLSHPGQAQIISDRAAAIRLAVTQASVDDVVLVAGKGHETWQQIGQQKYPFNDAEEVTKVLSEPAS